MKIEEAFEILLLKSEKNGVNDNIATDRGRAVQLINESFLRYIEYILEKKNDDDLRQIQPLLTRSPKINGVKKDNYYEFDLPEDFFDFSSLNATADKEGCRDDLEILTEVKDFNINLVLSDSFTKPSFEYREAPFIFSDNKVKIFTDGTFEIPYIKTNYYRYPVQARLLNPDDPESQFDESVELELGEKVINRVISLAVGEFDMRNNNPRAQANIQRTISKI